VTAVAVRFKAELQRIRAALEGPLQSLDLARVAAHNLSYSRRYAAHRFKLFVQDEWPYYARVLQWYREHVPKGSSVLDIGTFIPVVPLLLSWEGYCVTTVEKVSLYDGALESMEQIMRQHGVDFHNADIMDEEFNPGTFDTINLLAVVEHLLGSPRELLVRIYSMLRPSGAMVFAVPNQARLIRRLGLFFGGISVQPDYADYFESKYPFEGHHREYTKAEVHYALTNAGFRIEELSSVRYPPEGGLGKWTISLVANVLPATFHQVLFAIARKH
jgi:2-polyprenyl-3-methyl-5-hydroxy-6-metoxy-1,4-benzoquinol methylase